jgi:hydrogenase maturation factor
MAAFDKKTGDFVAQLYIGPVNWTPPEFQIGYFVDRAHEGQGYVTEVVRAALRFIFERLKAHRVSLECDDTNVRSYRVAERCGMVQEAHVRENRKGAEGAVSGRLCYGLSRSEFDRLAGSIESYNALSPVEEVKMTRPVLPVGKLPPALLSRLLKHAPVDDPRVLLGPGTGLDCAVVDMGESLLVYNSDPITLAADDMGWYLVQVNANDIATTGAEPRWMMLTILLPERTTGAALVEGLAQQVFDACRALKIAVIGGHTEITYGLDRPILVATMIGEVARGRLVTPRGVQPGNRLLLTKGIPIEATSILAREFADELRGALNEEEILRARGFLHDPGISVVRDAAIAIRAGAVTAMHDPTEGGLSMALWELAEASGRSLHVNLASVPIAPLAARACRALGVDPLAAIASGALLLAVSADDAPSIRHALESASIVCAEIGSADDGPPGVWQWTRDGDVPLACPARDEIARLYDNRESGE